MAFASVEKLDKKPINSDNWRLYYLLELEPPVTARQVQWTFRKVTLRHHFFQAYRVLSNSDRKSLYDIIGEDAVGFILSGNWGPLITFLGAKKSIGLYCGSMLLLTALLILFFSFLALRVDSVVAWPWISVSIPLFIFFICILVIALMALIANLFSKVSQEEGLTFVHRIPAIGNFLAATLYFIFCFVIMIQIKDDTAMNSKEYLRFFYILVAGDIIYYLSSLLWRWPHYVRLQMQVDANHPNPLLCYGFFVLAFVYIILSVAQWVAIGQKIDGKTSASWYVVFIPLALRAAFRILEAFMHSMVKWTIGIRTVLGVAFDTIASFFINGCLLVALYFSAVRITRGPEVYPISYSLIPLYLVLAYVFCALIMTAVYLVTRNDDNERQEQLRNLRWTPEGLATQGEGRAFLFEDPTKEADWGDIGDEDPSDVLTERFGRDPYDEVGTDNVGQFTKVPRVTAPFGVSAPPDEEAPIQERWEGSPSNLPFDTPLNTVTGTGSMSTGEGGSSGPTERPPRSRDPYDPGSVTAPLRYTPTASEVEMSGYAPEGDEEDYGDYEEGEDDVATETQVSSSPTSSPIFTSGNPTPHR